MKSVQHIQRNLWRLSPRWSLAVLAAALLACLPAGAATNLVLWDTGSRLGAATETTDRSGWTAVPSTLFIFEADPPKAASDPGYYGREYSFKGDVVVENRSMMAVCLAAQGRVVFYAKGATAGVGGNIPIAEFAPLGSAPASPASQPGTDRPFEILRNASDEIALRVSFSSDTSATLSFGRDEVVEIKAGPRLKTIRLLSPIERGIVPGFVGDDLIIGPEDAANAETLSLPCDQVFVGLLRGEASALVLTWPKPNAPCSLETAADAQGRRTITAVNLQADGQSVYLAGLSAPGLWHREELKAAYLEKDTALAWQRPFKAKWKTQLSEAGVRTTFAFRETKGQIWRGVPGSYEYPVWFQGEQSMVHLSKKVPPRGEAIVYFLEPQNTPEGISTPVDLMKATLGRAACEPLLDVMGQKLRTHHRRGGEGVHRACTCGCTEAIQAIFEKGEEMARHGVVKEALGDMNYFVERHVERIEEYRRFAGDMLQFLRTQAGSKAELKEYLEGLEQITGQIPQEYDVQKDNMKSLAHASELTQRTLALTGTRSTNNLASYMELLKAWRAMGGAQDYVVAQCHTITRKLFQEAGYQAIRSPAAAEIARQVRARCRQVLRNPDGYEIWADY